MKETNRFLLNEPVHNDGRVFVTNLLDRSVSTITLPYPSSGPAVLWYKFTDIIATANAGPFGIAIDPQYDLNKRVSSYAADCILCTVNVSNFK
jgi:hypothetical protein